MNKNLAFKLILSFYGIVFLAFVVLTAFLLNMSRLENSKMREKAALDFLKDGMIMIEKEQQYLLGVADYFSTSAEVQQMLGLLYNGAPKQGLPEPLKMAFCTNPHLVSIVFYDRLGRPVDYMSIDDSHTPITQLVDKVSTPIGKMLSKDISYTWEYIPQGSSYFMSQDNSPKLCIWHVIRHNMNKQILGFLAASVDVRNLLYSNRIDEPLYNELILINYDKRMVFNRTGYPLIEGDLQAIHKGDSGELYSLSFGKYYVYKRVAGDTGLIIYSLIAKDKRMSIWTKGTFAAYSIVAFFLYLLFLFPLFMFITRALTRPLERLESGIIEFAEGNFDANLSFKYDDEVGRLGLAFNMMVEENKRLVQRNYMLKIKEKEAELAALTSQMSPHFLFNTLNSIQWSALEKGELHTADLICTLGQHIRTVTAPAQLSDVEQQTNVVKNYLKLQKLRLGDKLKYCFFVDETAKGIKVPSFILQPLVENSIVHGMDGLAGTLTITVVAKVVRDTLILQVLDNGSGITDSVLASLPPHSNSNSICEGIALSNLYSRLSLIYGNEFSFSISSVPYETTAVVIAIPSSETDSQLEEPSQF